jgi:hypothetical protein
LMGNNCRMGTDWYLTHTYTQHPCLDRSKGTAAPASPDRGRLRKVVYLLITTYLEAYCS